MLFPLKSFLKDGKPYIVLFGIISITALLYSKSINFDFYLDDYRIQKNIFLRSPIDIYSAVKNDANRPIGVIIWIVISLLFGVTPEPYHLLAIFLHILCGIALYITVREITANTSAGVKANPVFFALIVTSCFLFHPIQTESVIYAVQSTSVLPMGLFVLLTVISYIRFRTCGKTYYVAALLFFSLSASFSRETAIVIPVLIWLIEFLLIQKGEFKTSFHYWHIHLIHLTVSLFSFLLCAHFYSDKGVSLYAGDVRGLTLNGVTPFYYLLTQFRVVARYIFLLLLPIGQNLDYDFPIYTSFFTPAVMLSFSLLAVYLVCAIKVRKRYPLFTFGVFWFFLFLLPTSSIVPIRDVIFEHRLYMPMIGAAISFFSLILCYKDETGGKMSVPGIMIFIPFMFIVLTCLRQGVWKDNISLWTDVIKKSPKKPRGYNNRGLEYHSLGRYKEAVEDFSRAILLKADLAEAYNNLGLVYSELKDYKKAIKKYSEAIQRNPDFFEFYYNRGLAYKAVKRYKRAVYDFTEAVKRNPKYKDAYLERALSYYSIGDYSRAMADINRTVKLNPAQAEAYNLRGRVYIILGEYGRAIKDYTRAIALQPDSWEFLNNRGIAYWKTKEYASAIRDFNNALRLDPKNSKIYSNRGNIYYLTGDYDKAIKDYSRSISINHDDPYVHFNMGMLYEKTGRLERSVKSYREALRVAPDDPDTHLRLGQVYARLGLFKDALKSLKKAASLGKRDAMSLIDTLQEREE